LLAHDVSKPDAAATRLDAALRDGDLPLQIGVVGDRRQLAIDRVTRDVAAVHRERRWPNRAAARGEGDDDDQSGERDRPAQEGSRWAAPDSQPTANERLRRSA